MSSGSTITEADILDEVIDPRHPGFNAEVARSLLGFRFSDRTKDRIRVLLDANNRGTISPVEHNDLDKYLRVGQLLDLLQAKARVSLKTAPPE